MNKAKLNKSNSENIGIKNVIFNCANLKRNERVVLIYDRQTSCLVKNFAFWIKKRTNCFTAVEDRSIKMHGYEPSLRTQKFMKRCDLIFALTSFSIAHTHARRLSSINGARFLSLPEYSKKILRDDSLKVNFKKCLGITKRVSNILTFGKRILIKTKKGTHLNLNIKNRIANCCPGFVKSSGDLGSPPDIESNISPREEFSNGRIIVDGSIPHPTLGLLKEEILIDVKHGFITNISGNDFLKNKVKKLFESVNNKKAKILAECGIGMNPRANLKGLMLTDEGSMGTLHLGFGSNDTVGGKNNVPFHLDFVIRKPSLFVDEKLIIRNGKFVI